MPRRRRLLSHSGLAAALVAALVSLPGAARAQTPALDSGTDLLQPWLAGNPTTPPPFRRRDRTADATAQDQTPPTGTFAAPSRIGSTPVYGAPAGFGAATTGFDPTNTARWKKRTPRTAQRATGQAPPDSTFAPVPNFSAQPVTGAIAPAAASAPAEIQPRKAADRPGAALPTPAEAVPISNPPPQVYPRTAAQRPGATLPIPPASAFDPSAAPPTPGALPLNTLPLGMPQRPLPIAEGDPYAPLGLQAGSFLVYPSVELSAGYDNNPEHVPGGVASSLFVVAPELQVQSNWSRHSLTADIRGTYTTYGADLSPSLDAPYLNGTIDGRIDVRHDTQLLLQNRFLVSTDNPGSPNLQAGLAKLPIYTDIGGTIGLAHTFNRLQVTVKGTFDRTSYANSVLTDGEVVSNSDRDFNQYGGILRVAYEFDPGLKPFVEVDEDKRVFDQNIDSNGLARNSTGTRVQVGADVNLFGTLTGEFATGYLARFYQSPLPNVGGFIADGSLIWQATPLTTAKLTAASTVTDIVLPGASGEFSRDYSLQVDHAFLLWVIGTLQAGYGHDDYVGLGRQDNRYFVSGGVLYKLSRELQLKGTLRQDWLTSNVAGVAYNATSVLMGLRLQR